MAPTRQHTQLGAALKEQRRTQVWLADTVGVQPRAVWTWVHGIHEPDEDTKAKVACALSLPKAHVFPPSQPADVAA